MEENRYKEFPTQSLVEIRFSDKGSEVYQERETRREAVLKVD